MSAYYNEINPYAAQWLRNLIAAGHIAPGDVDERSIVEVQADDLKGYTQCHFFAGIGGWSHALRLAGWSDDRPVWTGSCPCQPFSSAGKQDGHADERHLWPHWFRLIRECRPATIFGEQVAGAITFGWLDEVFNDLEKETYACASAILPACSVGHPHKRDRLWFVANASSTGFSQRSSGEIRGPGAQQKSERYGIMGNAEHYGRDRRSICESDGGNVSETPQRTHSTFKLTGTSKPDHVAYTCGARLSNGEQKIIQGAGGQLQGRAIAESGTYDWIECPDGKIRPVKSGLRLLANGIPGRVGKLRAYGNAIVPRVAAEFIKATM